MVPAKVLAMTCIDLVYNKAAEAKRIIKAFKPTISPKVYTEFMHKFVE